MKLGANKSARIDFNDVTLSTLIEQNSDAIDVNFISRNNFNNNAYRGNFNPDCIPEIPLIIMVIHTIIIGYLLILRSKLNNL